VCHGEPDDVEEAGDGLLSVASFNVLDELAGIEADEAETHCKMDAENIIVV